MSSNTQSSQSLGVDFIGYPWSLQAEEVVTAGVKRLADFNRRTLDGLAARLYFYYSLVHEHTGTPADIRRCCIASQRLNFLLYI